MSTATVSTPSTRDDPIPLVRRFPALAAIPRARLGRFPTPVERLDGFRDVDSLWVKHEDLSSDALGGNKVRSLEFLLGRVGEGDTMLTLGGEGSTHVLATAVHAARLGAKTIAVRWRHDMFREHQRLPAFSQRLKMLLQNPIFQRVKADRHHSPTRRH